MIIQISFIFFIGNSRQAKIQNKKFKDKFIQVYIIAKKKKKDLARHAGNEPVYMNLNQLTKALRMNDPSQQ
jgi:hypothetical protein